MGDRSRELTSAERFAIAAAIVAVLGLAFSVYIHFFYYAAQGRTRYPYSTFLGLESLRYSDFWDTLDRLRDPAPYRKWTLYFPATFFILRPLVWFTVDGNVVRIVFFVISGAVILYTLHVAQVRRGRWLQLRIPILITCFASQPILYVWDRANIEILTLAFVGLFALDLSRDRPYRAGFWLALPGAMKLAPGVFGLMLLRRRRFGAVAVVAALSIVLTWLGLMLLDGSISDNLAGLRFQHDTFERNWMIGLDGLVRSCSFHGALRAIALFFGVPLVRAAEIASLGWALFVLVNAILLAFYVWKRPSSSRLSAFELSWLAALLCLVPKVSGDYKLGILLVVFMASEDLDQLGPRAAWGLGALFGLVLVPKNFYILDGPGFARIDSHMRIAFSDITIGCVVTPALIVAFVALLFWQAPLRQMVAPATPTRRSGPKARR